MDSVYQQTTCETCLPVCLLSLSGKPFTQADEMSLYTKGILSFRDLYSFSIINTFAKEYSRETKLLVDNKYYTNFLAKLPHDSRLHISHAKIDLSFIENFVEPYVVYVDHYVLGADVHVPHFILVLGKTRSYIRIGNPWTGKVSLIRKEKLHASVVSLKKYLKFCPLVVRVEK